MPGNFKRYCAVNYSDFFLFLWFKYMKNQHVCICLSEDKFNCLYLKIRGRLILEKLHVMAITFSEDMLLFQLKDYFFIKGRWVLKPNFAE